jgi:hypothetical protein
MMFTKHALGFFAFNLLLRALPAFAQEDQVEFETEFRLMILTGDPDNMEIAVTNEDKTESVETHDNHLDWAIENDRGKDDGNLLLSWVGFSHPSDQERKVWIYKKGEDRESGRIVSHRELPCKQRADVSTQCTVVLNHDPKVPRLDWYLRWGLDFENTINAFDKPEELKIKCTGMVPPPPA